MSRLPTARSLVSRRLQRVGAALGLLATLTASPAHAEELPPLAVPATKSPAGLLAYVALGASIDRPAAAVIGGVHYRFSPRWIVGLDAEWNPWFDRDERAFSTGVASGYGTLIRQFPLQYEPVNLRITLNLGTTMLLEDKIGAPAYRLGVFAGLSPLGVEWRLNSWLHVVFDPVHVVIPAPQLTGVPFVYVQYRLTLGLEFE